MRFVLDTDVIVSAMRSPTGASAALILSALDGLFVLVANVPLVVEYEATCSLAEHRDAAGLDDKQVGQFLDALAALAEPVPTYFLGDLNYVMQRMKWCWKRQLTGKRLPLSPLTSVITAAYLTPSASKS